MSKMIFQHIVCHGDVPIKSADGQFVVFSTKKGAQDKVKEMKVSGFKDLKIKVNYIYL